MIVINGKETAAEIIAELKKLPRPQKVLAAVLVGNNSASISFLKQKERVADELGITFELKRLPENTTAENLIETIKNLGDNKNIGGLILQLPLPTHLDRDAAVAAIPKEKDVDALRPDNDLVLAPAAVTVKTILGKVGFGLRSKKVSIVGRGFLVGQPIANWLEKQNTDFEIFDINSPKDKMFSALKKADLVITGTGQTGLIKPDMLKPNAGVIDFGYGIRNGKVYGDLETHQLTNSSTDKLAFYTPTPGGTGPILVAELFRNFYFCNSAPSP